MFLSIGASAWLILVACCTVVLVDYRVLPLFINLCIDIPSELEIELAKVFSLQALVDMWGHFIPTFFPFYLLYGFLSCGFSFWWCDLVLLFAL